MADNVLPAPEAASAAGAPSGTLTVRILRSNADSQVARDDRVAVEAPLEFQLHHPALGQSPREACEAGLARTGQRAHRMIPYDREFLVHTLPATPKGTAKALSGDAQVKPDGAAVKGTLVIDAASFDTKNEKRDDHLRSEDNANRAGDGRFNSPGRPKGAAWRTGRRAQSAP